jgi:hypothetical protein
MVRWLLMRLLLDAHFSPSVSRPLRSSGIDTFTLDEWKVGSFRHEADEVILAAAFADERTLVTYDCRSIRRLLGEWGIDGRSHGGVVLIDDHTVRQGDFGGQIRALRALVERHGDEAWVDRVLYLAPA